MSSSSLRARASALYGRIGAGDLVRHGTPLFAAITLASLAVFGLHFYASRRLGVTLYGGLASLLAVVTLVVLLSGVGSSIVARFTAEFEALGERGKIRRLFELVVKVCLGVFLAAGTTAALAEVPLARFLRVEPAHLIVWVALLCAAVFSGGLLRGLLQGSQRFIEFSVSFVIENVGRALFGSLAIAFGFGLAGAFITQVAAGILTLVYTCAVLHAHLRVRASSLRIGLRKLAWTSSGIAMASLCLALLSYFDIVLAKHYLVPYAAGIYGFATLPGRMLSSIASVLPTLVLPKAAARTTVGTHSTGVLYAALGAAVALCAFALGVFFVFPHAIIRFTGGPAFAAAAPLVFPYGCAAGLISLTRIAVSYDLGRHRFQSVIPLSVLTAAEITGIALFHASAWQIVEVVLAANAVAALVSLCFATWRRKLIPGNAG